MITITLNRNVIAPLLALITYILFFTIRIAFDIGNIEPSYEITREFPIALFILISLPAILGFVIGYNFKLK